MRWPVPRRRRSVQATGVDAPVGGPWRATTDRVACGAAVFGAAAVVCGPVQAESVVRDTLADWLRRDRSAVVDPVVARATLVLAAYRRATALAAEPGGRARLEDDRRSGGGVDGEVDVGWTQRAALTWLAEEERVALVVVAFGRCSATQAAVLLGEDERVVVARLRASLRTLAVAVDHLRDGAEPRRPGVGSF